MITERISLVHSYENQPPTVNQTTVAKHSIGLAVLLLDHALQIVIDLRAGRAQGRGRAFLLSLLVVQLDHNNHRNDHHDVGSDGA